MLNRHFIEEIKNSLNSKYFTLSDFQIESSESGSPLLHIIFNYADYDFKFIEVEEKDIYTETARYSFSGDIKRSESYTRYYAIYSPGKYKATDKVQVSFAELAEQIESWSSYIANDLVVVDNDDTLFEQIRDELEVVFTVKDVENEGQVASFEEQLDVSEKLDKLYERLEELNKKVQFASDEMIKIKDEIEMLKSSSGQMPKGIWAKVAKNRLVEIAIKFFKTPEGRELIVHTIKQALPS
ncbi:hypothetical protein A6E05_19205 [Aliivibrio sp. 1S165]|uniref:hypothetical protein n=1 Tax=unclassified Aliivibrio TaxID=2645654 RepID=UPI00080E34B5|nr:MULTISPECIES: hypothetical protein [unclassified Aliivibrio]OCH14333.1 hypothetical protein A6E05_19205 [Aliivibrio sp. 1S165]OCH28876.1 hypothetical protein A6E06_19400 [Aliivibrio sp. 1S175]